MENGQKNSRPDGTDSKENAAEGGNGFASIITQIIILDVVVSLYSEITMVGLTSNRGVIISAVLLSFVVILFFAKPIGDFILKHTAQKILVLAFLIVVGVSVLDCLKGIPVLPILNRVDPCNPLKIAEALMEG